MFKLIFCIIIAYFLGNISGGMIFGKLLFNKDIRDYGSKNAGTTNALRVFGIKAGALTFIVDLLKSILACFIGMKLLGLNGVLLAGIFVVIGHNWPVFLNFKGGKGIASSFGFIIFLDYKIAIVAIILFITIVVLTKYISLGSILTTTLVLPISYIFFKYRNIYVLLTFFLLASLSIYRHKSNIVRLINGNENKINFKK
ncbi:acyl-phosphate glycerol 3-phosphate acyltransferase [Parvimonas sp. oral taxon 110 str. F0139]|uniref:glycerol-3-phosphate 1-O-acyltransferase PlsY n=1 Tax=Parvimonas sp. TaxID=1944660 RepID=UPI00020DDD04|nr:glycerol-3-phosphate 1-O-acyltransferase PlsY [Parvimonas sp.]EGL35886.1 acyl-phosphate glycerol 3-phosphate acyltransferase [Parvimonas sp. oral taxon 110 str. F0139]MBF1294694.1 glycerol-3-phosphate 1-O-acyltransferase PlsY [Parvimonas sp.]